MRLLTRRKPTPTEELKNAAIEALVSALDGDKQEAKPRTTGVRALATGAVIYTAGVAAFKGQRFVREQLSSGTEDDQAEDLEDEEEYEEPEAEEYELDEEDDEPEAYEEDEDEPEDDEEPEAYDEEDEPEDDDEPEAYEEEDEPEASEEDEDEPDEVEDDDESRSETPTPVPERKPVRRAARKKGAQPSLKLPKQRRPRIPVSKD